MIKRLHERSRRCGAASVVVIVALAAGLSVAVPIALAPGDPAPQLGGLPLGKKEHAVVQWTAARFTLVNFWATWCAPCREEIPKLEKLFEEHSGEGLGVIGVYDQDTDEAIIRGYLSPLGVTYPILKADQRVDRDWGGISAWPTTFVIRNDGTIVRRYVGATPEQTAGLIADVEGLLAGRPLGAQILPVSPEISMPADRVKESRRAQGLPEAPEQPEKH